MSSRSRTLQTEILNSSDKRMEIGEKPGPLKSTAEVRRHRKRNKSQGDKSGIKESSSEKNKK